MATAYVSILTLNYKIIDHIQLHTTRNRKPSYTEKQLKQVESLNDITIFFENFLEKHSSINNELVEFLETQIGDAADAAVDIIESYMVDCAKCPSLYQNLSSEASYQGLDKVIEDMNSIKKKVMDIQDQLQLHDPAASSGPPTSQNDTSAVKADHRFNEIMDKLYIQKSDLQIIPITGMGGIGKTTLAKKVYDLPNNKKFFDVCAWVTISQVYSIEKLLSTLLEAIPDHSTSESTLHKRLFGRRYLIILDDMWDTKVWDELRLSFPENNNQSRIIVTTRLLKVANYVNSSNLYEVDFLDEIESWSMLCRKAFGQEGCPYPEFVRITKEIAGNCKGLPLSINVIAGILAKSKLTLNLLKTIVNDTNEKINSEDNGETLRILGLSYNHLPIHLKPCLLHLGSYREDANINITNLVRLWVAKGFLKPNITQSLEDVAIDYLMDLMERNLVMVGDLGKTGRMKTCTIHDLIRELCLRKIDKSKFLCESTHTRYIDSHLDQGIKLLNGRRYLETILIRGEVPYAAKKIVELDRIWKMLELRHLKCDAYVIDVSPAPPFFSPEEEESVLENLQTLKGINNLKFTEEVVKRIPNVKKLKLEYDYEFEGHENYFLDILASLHKLEALKVNFSLSVPVYNFRVFPPNLKKLELKWGCIFDEIIGSIGELPNLESLTLKDIDLPDVWESVEGHFVSLKFLEIRDTSSLIWIADDSHFPVLESLVLRWVKVEIPIGFAESTTLRSILLQNCNEETTVNSARKILDEQKSLCVEDEDTVHLTVW